MKTFIQDGQVVPMTVPAGGVTSGSAYLIGGVVVVAMQDNATVGAKFPAMVDGAVWLPKLAGQAQPEGSVLYWDTANKWLTTVSSGNTKCGFAFNGGALAADTLVQIRLYAQSQ